MLQNNMKPNKKRELSLCPLEFSCV